MQSNILINDAIQNVWCEPIQDFQHVLKPQRLSAAGGAYKAIHLLMGDLKLPNYDLANDRSRFHVYQVGFQWKSSFSIEIDYRMWVRSDLLMVANKLLVDTYFENGCMIARTDVYVQFTDDSNMVVAVRLNSEPDYGSETIQGSQIGDVQTRKISLENHTPIVRFYNSAYYRSSEWRDTTLQPINPVRVISRKITSSNDFSSFMAEANAIEAQFGTEGASVYWVDGFVESKPVAYALRYKDKILTMIRESAIREVVMIPGTDLPTYISKLDNNFRKYIALSTSGYKTLDYQDDVDIYLVKRNLQTYRGVLLTRFRASTVRQITHNCYALDAAVVRTVLDSHPDVLGKLTDIHVMMVVRNSSRAKGLNHQAVRIEELYHLSRKGILEALTGVNSLMPEWRADYLENSSYCRVMRAQYQELKQPLVEDAYGYNAAAVVGEPTYHVPDFIGGQYQMQVPPTFTLADNGGSTYRSFYIYDDRGHYLESWSQYALTDRVVLPTLATVGAVEVIHTQTSSTNDGCFYENTVITRDLEYWGYRCYTCSINNGVPNEIWEDVTDNTSFYTYTKDSTGVSRITWNVALLTQHGLYPCVKVGRYTHEQTKQQTPAQWQGYVQTVVQSEVVFQGVQSVRPQRLAPGTIDVTINGYNLIEGLDYIVKWPTIVIVRRMADPLDYQNAKIVVRSRGWCNPTTGKHTPPREVGWVKDGRLSMNGTYDPRRDRNARLVIDGMLYNPANVSWAEDESVARMAGGQIEDGRAYAVTDVFTVMESWTGQQTVPYRLKSMEIDKRVSEYLTERMDEPPEDLPTVNGQRWGLYSPFLSALIFQLQGGWLTQGQLAVQWDNNDVTEWVQPYRFLLDYDPCLLDHDPNYVWIYAHPYYNTVSVTRDQYRFLEYIVKNYLRSKIDLTPSVTIVG